MFLELLTSKAECNVSVKIFKKFHKSVMNMIPAIAVNLFNTDTTFKAVLFIGWYRTRNEIQH